MNTHHSKRTGAVPVIVSGILAALLMAAPATLLATEASPTQAGDHSMQADTQDAGDHGMQNKQPAAEMPTKDMGDAPPRQMQVSQVAICREVAERQPVMAGDSFASGVNNLYCFTEIRNAGMPQQIYHRWYVGDELVCEVPMSVEGPRWRCWSEKTIPAGWEGPCHVEIVTESGERIGETRFALVDQPEMSAESWDKPAVDNAGDGS
ncbi:DUF2914 domain-containing protein [bacterium]|nr:DUF2914 domain-containing protein [bacterium]